MVYWWRKTQRKPGRVELAQGIENRLAAALKTARMGFCSLSACRKRAQSIGVSVSEMTPETKMAALSVTANS